MSREYVDIALALAAAWAAGSLIGLERTFHGRPAGFRTHALVSLASALLMVVTKYQWEWLGAAPLDSVRTDPTRMAQGIMTGIGFLGAGVIFKEGPNVRGLTTAASIWMTAALGILFGVGLHGPGALGTGLTLGILAVFRWFERMLPSQHPAHHSVRFPRDRVPPESEFHRVLRAHGFGFAHTSYELLEGGVFEYRTVVTTRKMANHQRLADHWRRDENVIAFTLAPAEE